MPPTSLVASRPRTPAFAGPPGDGAPAHRAGPTLALLLILAAQLMVVLDATIVNVALPRIQASLGFSSASLSWVLNAYILAFGGLLLLGSRAGDLLGRRRIFVIGILVFTLGSLVGGFAPTAGALLAARAVQGVGGALAAPSALALLTNLFPEGAERVRAIALYTTVSATGGAIGLLAGGVLTEWADWRWVMFVNVPIGAVVSVLARRVLPETPARRGRFDVAGALCSTLGMAALVFGLVHAGTAGWANALTLAALGAAALLLVAFVAIERGAEEPVLPLGLLVHSTRSAANVARGLVYCGMYGMFFFLTQFLQDVQGYSPILTGLCFLPMPLSVFASSQFTSRVLMPRMAPKRLMLTGLGLAAGGLLVASRLGVGSSYALVAASLVLVGVGSGVSFVSLTTASLAGVAPGQAGAASGLINVSQQLGAALGVAVLVTVFGDAAHHTGLRAGLDRAAAALVTHGLHEAFSVGLGFALLAFGVVAAAVRPARAATVELPAAPNPDDELVLPLDAA